VFVPVFWLGANGVAGKFEVVVSNVVVTTVLEKKVHAAQCPLHAI
jgi:hypothetical protein